MLVMFSQLTQLVTVRQEIESSRLPLPAVQNFKVCEKGTFH